MRPFSYYKKFRGLFISHLIGFPLHKIIQGFFFFNQKWANGMEISFEKEIVENCFISVMQAIQPKIPEIPGGKSNGMETQIKWNGNTWRDCPLFRKFRKMLHWKFLKCKWECLVELMAP